jgi:ABC-type transport system involved in cytochrome c biogenesis permease subunit
MKRWISLIALLIGVAWVAGSLRPLSVAPGEIDLSEFGRLPVLAGGRIKPMDTVARNSLLILHGKQRVKSPEGKRVQALRWFADALFDPAKADAYPAFVIHHPEVLGLFGWQQTDRKHFRYQELTPFLRQIDEQGQQAEQVESARRSTYQVAILNLRKSLILYQRIQNSLAPVGTKDFVREIEGYGEAIAAGREIVKSGGGDPDRDRAKLEQTSRFVKRFDAQSKMAYFLSVPPLPGGRGEEWVTTGGGMLQAFTSDAIHPVVMGYARMGDAYRAGDKGAFEKEASELRRSLAGSEGRAVHRAEYEFFFNRAEPFYRSMGLYVLAVFLACASWLGWSRPLARSAFWLLVLALAVHTFGLASRMYLQERPPVTNLYSSAIFIGWGTVVIGLVLERIFKDGIGAACAGAVGFLTLIIAHHLAGSGDTLEMLQAVLDTNLWLATHVVVITAGYSAMFLAGMLALLYVVRGVFTRSLSPATAASLARVVYGVICFATLTSFVGTVLGGIWADQSWGRFWGWDPKEKGALLIVLWCAIVLHARAGGHVGDRGLIVMALFGNVITSFSWFGVNMLGVGLHSYGFMEKAFPWLVGFMVAQVALMAVAGLPLERWRSFRDGRATA